MRTTFFYQKTNTFHALRWLYTNLIRIAFLFLMLVGLSLFSSQKTAAQNEMKIENLLNQLDLAKDTTEMVDILNNIALELSDSDFEMAIQYANQAEQIAKKISYYNGVAKSYLTIGVIHAEQNMYNSALENYSKGLKISRKINARILTANFFVRIGDILFRTRKNELALEHYYNALKIFKKLNNNRGKAIIFDKFGAIYEIQGNFKQALDNYLKSLKIKQHLEDKQGIADSYKKIGMIYTNQGNYKDAINYFDQSLELLDDIDDRRGIAEINNHKGFIYEEQGNYKSAITFFFNSLIIYDELNDKTGIATSNRGIGDVYEKQGNYERAIEFYEKSLKTSQEINDKNGIAQSYFSIGKYYNTISEYRKAIDYLKKSFQLAQKIGSHTVESKASEELSKAYAKINDYKNAYAYYMHHKEVSDIINSEEITKRITQLELEHKFKQRQQEEEMRQRQKEKEHQAELKRTRDLRNFFIAAFGLMILLAFFIFRNYRMKQKANKLLAEQKEEIQARSDALKKANEAITKQNQIIEKKNKSITASINYAEHIQSAMLPEIEQIRRNLPNTFILFKPRDIVSGDFYWSSDILEEPDGTVQALYGNKKVENYYDINATRKTIITAVDCTGHGVPGAFMSMIGDSYLNQIINLQGITEPHIILGELHKNVRKALRQDETRNSDGMDMALCVIDKENQILEFAGAMNPLVYIQDDEINIIDGDKTSIGGLQREERRTFTKHTIDISKPTTFYIFTDGYADQFGGQHGRKLMTKKFYKILHEIHQKPANEQKAELEGFINEWIGSRYRQIDDILVIGVQV